MSHGIQQLVDIALSEDIGTGDVTSLAIIPPDGRAIGQIIAKQSLVLAGMDVAKRVFKTVEEDISWDPRKDDGIRCEPGDVLATVEGSARTLLSAERTALNFLGRMSGIATITNLFVTAARTMNVRILDTRKTTPGWRELEKYSVKMGGATNHRMGLYDQFLIKNNHIDFAGSLEAAVTLALAARKPGQLVEVETRNLDEVEEALETGVDIIMLDNMSVGDVRSAVKMVKGKVKLEVSGKINLENLLAYAATGVDYISSGVITHSATAADMHMLIKTETK